MENESCAAQVMVFCLIVALPGGREWNCCFTNCWLDAPDVLFDWHQREAIVGHRYATLLINLMFYNWSNNSNWTDKKDIKHLVLLSCMEGLNKTNPRVVERKRLFCGPVCSLLQCLFTKPEVNVWSVALCWECQLHAFASSKSGRRLKNRNPVETPGCWKCILSG